MADANQTADAPKMVTVKLLRAFWPEEDKRVDAGAQIDLPQDAAKKAIDSGLAEFIGVA